MELRVQNFERSLVQYSDWSLDFGRRDLVLLKLLIKRAARDSKTLRGFLNAAAAPPEAPSRCAAFRVPEVSDVSREKVRLPVRVRRSEDR